MNLPANTWHWRLIQQAVETNTVINDAGGNPKYGVSVTPVADPSRPHYKAIVIHHLTGEENHGQHNVFCEVVDEDGQRLNLTRIEILTNGNPRGSMVIDKPVNEPGTNTQMHWNDTLTVFVDRDGLPSEQVAGMHTRHDDEEAGTTRGHHSYFVGFQRVAGDDPGEDDPGTEEPGEPDTPPDDTPPGDDRPDTGDGSLPFTEAEREALREALRILSRHLGG